METEKVPQGKMSFLRCWEDVVPRRRKPSQSQGRDGKATLGRWVAPCPGQRQSQSVLSHRWGRELQLEVLVLEDTAESRASLGATERPVALAASVLGEFGEERQPGASSVQSAKLIKCLDLLWIQNRF